MHKLAFQRYTHFICKNTCPIIIILIGLVHTSLQGGFSITKIEKMEIFKGTKTILKTSNKQRSVIYLYPMKLWNVLVIVKRFIWSKFCISFSEASFNALYCAMKIKIVGHLTGTKQFINVFSYQRKGYYVILMRLILSALTWSINQNHCLPHAKARVWYWKYFFVAKINI